MDDIYRRRKQNENPMRPPSDPRYQQQAQDGSQRRQYHQSGSSSSDHQRMPSGGRVLSSSSSAAGYGGYYQEAPESAYAASHGAMAYSQQPTDYAQDARQAQGFANTYNPSSAQMMYGVQPTSGQGTVFDTSQAYASRQHGSMQMMAPDAASSGYYASDSTGSGAVAMHGGASSSVYQHHGAADSRGNAAATGYGAGMVPLPSANSSQQPAASSNIGGSSSAAAAAAAAAASSSQDYAETDESYTAYQRTLKDVFKNIKSGSLTPASESLLSISDWLLSRVESLGVCLELSGKQNDFAFETN